MSPVKWTPVARAEDIPPGEARVYEVGDEWIAICNVEGDYFAVEDRCTHDEGPLGDGTLEGHNIECPRHGACFDVRSGKITRMPAYAPIRTFPVSVQGGIVLIDLQNPKGGVPERP